MSKLVLVVSAKTKSPKKKNKSGLRFNADISVQIRFMADKFAVEAFVAVVSPTCFLSTRLQPKNVKLNTTESFTIAESEALLLVLSVLQLIHKQETKTIKRNLDFMRIRFSQI